MYRLDFSDCGQIIWAFPFPYTNNVLYKYRGRILGWNPDKSLKSFSFLLFTVTSKALPWDFYFIKITQPLIYFYSQLLHIVKEKGGEPNRKPCTLPYGYRIHTKTLYLIILKIMPRSLHEIVHSLIWLQKSSAVEFLIIVLGPLTILSVSLWVWRYMHVHFPPTIYSKNLL